MPATINDIMKDQTWDQIKDNPEINDKVIAEVVDMSSYLGQMSSSASSVLCRLSTLYNILSPYMRDAMEAAAKNIVTATDEIQSMINPIREASRNVRGIVNYLNAQPDIQFFPCLVLNLMQTRKNHIRSLREFPKV